MKLQVAVSTKALERIGDSERNYDAWNTLLAAFAYQCGRHPFDVVLREDHVESLVGTMVRNPTSSPPSGGT